MITSIIDATVGLSLTQTSAWIYFPVTSSYNSILDDGEHAILVVAFSVSDRPDYLDQIKVEIVLSSGATLTAERQVPVISNAVIDLG